MAQENSTLSYMCHAWDAVPRVAPKKINLMPRVAHAFLFLYHAWHDPIPIPTCGMMFYSWRPCATCGVFSHAWHMKIKSDATRGGLSHAWHMKKEFDATRGTQIFHATRGIRSRFLVPPVASLPGSLTTRGLTPPALPPARFMCHTWHARRPLRPCRRTCHAWTHSARAAPWLCMCHTWHARRTRRPLAVHVPRVASLGTHCPCQGICHTWHARLTRRPCRLPAHVPRVARTPHPPPSAWRMCRAWHVRRALRRPPGACATRGTYAARSAACLAHVPLFTARAAPRLAFVPCVASRRARRPCVTRGTWR